MTQDRRPQRAAPAALPADVEKALERQIKSEKKRNEYNKRPDVLAKRKEYQTKQQKFRAIARAALKGDVAKLVGFGYTEVDAKAFIQKAAGIKV